MNFHAVHPFIKSGVSIFGVNGSLASKNWSMFTNCVSNKNGSSSDSAYISVPGAGKIPSVAIYYYTTAPSSFYDTTRQFDIYRIIVIGVANINVTFRPSDRTTTSTNWGSISTSAAFTLSGTTLRIKPEMYVDTGFKYSVLLCYT